jgi:alpha-1,2-mannosyltransferase
MRGAATERAAAREHQWRWQRVMAAALFGALPLLLLAYVERKIFNSSSGFLDLRVLLKAGHDVLDGRSPYPSPANIHPHNYDYFVYPAPVAIAVAPLASLPFAFAAAIFSLSMVACTLLTLRILDVGDWRCYGAAFLWFPTLLAILVGNVTPLLALGVAVLWRFRDRWPVAALAVGLVIVTKLFLWPLLVWLVATRRLMAAFAAALGSAVITVAAWAAIGFHGFGDYLQLLSKLAKAEENESFSLVAFLHSLGVSGPSSRLLAIVVGALLVGAALLAVRTREGDRNSFVVVLGAALVLSPIVWLHFFALLLVPTALIERRLGPLWLLPICLWVLKNGQSHTNLGSTWRIALPLAVAGVIVLAARYKSDSRTEGSPPSVRADGGAGASGPVLRGTTS